MVEVSKYRLLYISSTLFQCPLTSLCIFKKKIDFLLHNMVLAVENGVRSSQSEEEIIEYGVNALYYIFWYWKYILYLVMCLSLCRKNCTLYVIGAFASTIWYCVLYESVWNLGNEHQRKTIQRPCWRESHSSEKIFIVEIFLEDYWGGIYNI